MNWEKFDWRSFWFGSAITAGLLGFAAGATGVFLP